MNRNKSLVVSALMVIGAPVVGFFLYQQAALQGSMLRWVAPMSMLLIGLAIALLAWPSKPDVDGALSELDRLVGGGTDEAVLSQARQELAALAASNPDANLLQVVEAFERVPALVSFATAIRRSHSGGLT